MYICFENFYFNTLIGLCEVTSWLLHAILSFRKIALLERAVCETESTVEFRIVLCSRTELRFVAKQQWSLDSLKTTQRRISRCTMRQSLT